MMIHNIGAMRKSQKTDVLYLPTRKEKTLKSETKQNYDELRDRKVSFVLKSV